MYNYGQEYNKIVKEGQTILDQSKVQYQEMKDKYNEQALQVEGSKLLKQTNDKLMDIKYKFLQEAQVQLEKQQQDIITAKQRKEANKTKEDLILDLLQRQSIIEDFEANITLLGGMNCIDQLEQIQDLNTFNVCKAKLLNAVDEGQKLQVQQVKYKDPELYEVQQNLLSVRLEDSRVLDPILPVTVRTVEEYVTGGEKHPSDIFFK